MTYKPQVLVVDDEDDILELVRITLARMEINAHCASSIAAARQALSEQTFDFCLTDMRLDDGDGTDLVRYANTHYPQMPIAMATAYGNMDSAVAAMKAGAFDFVSKPLDVRVLRQLTAAALRLRPQDTAITEPESTAPANELLGRSPQIKQLRSLILKVARNQAPVYIYGESGTGKELVASLIHRLGPRSQQPFVPVNCGAIPADLVESELFGHRKGAFTGAICDQPGLFQAAHGGTLFLDEIADLPLPTQVKLLRAIQEKSVRPVGCEKEVPVDVRIISASHRHLETELARGSFRQDLFYRINVIDLSIPPLRERREDIAVLVSYLLPRIAADSASPARELSADALAKLRGYDFPGNVRELENILERASALCDAPLLTAEDLRLPHAEPAPEMTEPQLALPQPVLPARLSQNEHEMLSAALAEFGADQRALAAHLGISPHTLQLHLRRLGLVGEDGQ